MSSIMRRRSGLMAISVIGGSCLEDEVCEPLDPQDGTAPAPSPVHLTPLIPSAALRAAPSRESGFVHWHQVALAAALFFAGFPQASRRSLDPLGGKGKSPGAARMARLFQWTLPVWNAARLERSP